MFMNSETQHSKDANSPQMIWGLTPFFVSRFNTVQFSSVAQSCPTLCDPMNRSTLSITQASLSITNSRSSPKLMSIELVMSSSHLILCRPLLLLPQSLPAAESFPMSQLCMRWPKYWSFSFSIIPSKEIPGLISMEKGKKPGLVLVIFYLP